MRVETTNVWDEYFFNQFVAFRNLIHRDIPTSFPEELSDYSRFFGPDSVFLNDIKWEAVLIKDNDRVLAKGILCWQDGGNTGNLGFLDWDNNIDASQILSQTIEASAKRNNLKSLKTPVDLNFFVKYRIKKPGGGKPFWGEPVYPDYYHDLYVHNGFVEVGHWDTYKIDKFKAISDYLKKRKLLAKKPTGSHDRTKNQELRTTVRCVNMKKWDSELRIIYDLFFEAYKSMPEWEPISFEQFKVIYDDFKYIINPWYAYIVELRGKPVGFSINFADPLSILSQYKNKKLNHLQKLLIFAKLRMNPKCFLIAHVGKIPGPNGEEIKGVQIQVSRRIQFIAAMMQKVLVTFQMTGSPSRRSFEEKSQKAYSQYVLYGKDI